MAVNSEGIYATRPWKIFGDGPVAGGPPSLRGMLDGEELKILDEIASGWPSIVKASMRRVRGRSSATVRWPARRHPPAAPGSTRPAAGTRSEEHSSELQSL